MFANVQLLRAIAAILVVLAHALPHYEVMGGSFTIIKFLGQWGFTGVDIFFVISGLVVSHTTFSKQRTMGNAVEFAQHRFFRVYLAYWLFLPVYYFDLLKHYPDRLHGMNIWDSILLINPDMFKLILPVAWSLCFEIYFYILFTLSFFVSVNIVKRLLYLFFLLIILRCLFFYHPDRSAIDFFLSPFLLEFLSGAIVYQLIQRFSAAWLIPLTGVTALTLFACGVMLQAKNGPVRMYTFGFSAALLVYTAMLIDKNKVYQVKKLFLEMGNASYTLYLVHLLALTIFYFSGLRTLLSHMMLPVREVGYLLFLVATIASSIIIYRTIERPLYKWACSLSLRHARIKAIVINK
ncbi:MAG TPA: acyltransferase [Spongiibacteraceae bacterium]|jgi:peptidoglycan/LPS O-acetylase OafA/YrhL